MSNTNSNSTTIYSSKDLCKLLHIGRDKAHALMKHRSFPSIHLGGRYLVTQDAFNRWLSDIGSKHIEL